MLSKKMNVSNKMERNSKIHISDQSQIEPYDRKEITQNIHSENSDFQSHKRCSSQANRRISGDIHEVKNEYEFDEK